MIRVDSLWCYLHQNVTFRQTCLPAHGRGVCIRWLSCSRDRFYILQCRQVAAYFAPLLSPDVYCHRVSGMTNYHPSIRVDMSTRPFACNSIGKCRVSLVYASVHLISSCTPFPFARYSMSTLGPSSLSSHVGSISVVSTWSFYRSLRHFRWPSDVIISDLTFEFDYARSYCIACIRISFTSIRACWLFGSSRKRWASFYSTKLIITSGGRNQKFSEPILSFRS